MSARVPLRAISAVGAACAAAALAIGYGSADAQGDACALPSTGPAWIEYGEGSVPPTVRAVFQRPGVTVAASGTAIPRTYRAKGAATVFFVLKLPRWAGTPAKPADPAGIAAAADRLYAQAVASTGCDRPWIGLNELSGPAAKTPWSPTTTTYRQNILGLMQGLAAKGATPVLFIHGTPFVAGEAATWWQQAAAAGILAYESYYKAPNVHGLGRILGPRRVRLGMRSVIRLFTTAGIPRERLGLVLGFQVKPGTFGREGLQPSQAWFRFVKWNALAAKQVTSEEKLHSVWSWGWGNLSAQAVDPDKPAAACVYLWARDASLCDGVEAAGPGFDRSRVEGLIVIPNGVQCISAAGKLGAKAIGDLARLTGDRKVALDALFARHALRKAVPLTNAELAAAEQQVIAAAFAGSRDAYLAALAQRQASPATALGILGDELRRQKLAATAAVTPGQTALLLAADRTLAELDTTTCLRDDLPGINNFPRSDRRELGVVPLAGYLPFLRADATPPLTPAIPTAAVANGIVTLDWPDGLETDLAGYHVYRLLPTDTAPVRLTLQPHPRSLFEDPTLQVGQSAIYTVRAIDTSANESAPTPDLPVAR